MILVKLRSLYILLILSLQIFGMKCTIKVQLMKHPLQIIPLEIVGFISVRVNLDSRMSQVVSVSTHSFVWPLVLYSEEIYVKKPL